MLRRQAVAAVRGGMTQAEAARVFGASERAVNEWMARSRAGGVAALAARRRGRRAERMAAEAAGPRSAGHAARGVALDAPGRAVAALQGGRPADVDHRRVGQGIDDRRIPPAARQRRAHSVEHGKLL